MASSLWIAIAALLCLVAIALIAWSLLAGRPRGRRRCPKCWYDMAGIDGLRCPECGREQRIERRLHRTRVCRRRLVPGVLLLLVAVFAFAHPHVRARKFGWWGFAPNWVLVEVAVRSDGAERWDHLDVRLAADRHPDPRWMILEYGRERLYGWSWRRLAAGCAETILDSERDADVQRRAASVLGTKIPDEDVITPALTMLAERGGCECFDEFAGIVRRCQGRFGRAPDNAAYRVVTLIQEGCGIDWTPDDSLAFLTHPGQLDMAFLRHVLAGSLSAEEWALPVLREYAALATPETQDEALAVLDRLRADEDSLIVRWRPYVARAREWVRTTAAMKDAAREDEALPALRLSAMTAFEAAEAVHGLFGIGVYASPVRPVNGIMIRSIVRQDARGAYFLDVDGRTIVRRKQLLRELANIHREEAGARGESILPIVPDGDSQLTTWRPLKPWFCRALAVRAERAHQMLWFYGLLPNGWAEGLAVECCDEECEEYRPHFAELLARGSTLHEDLIRGVLRECPLVSAPGVARGLVAGMSPAGQRLLFLEALLDEGAPAGAEMMYTYPLEIAYLHVYAEHDAEQVLGHAEGVETGRMHGPNGRAVRRKLMVEETVQPY